MRSGVWSVIVFGAAAAWVWNNLPPAVVNASSLPVLRNTYKNSSGDEIANVNFCTTTTYT